MRVFTQNIDGLDYQTGINPARVTNVPPAPRGMEAGAPEVLCCLAGPWLRRRLSRQLRESEQKPERVVARESLSLRG